MITQRQKAVSTLLRLGMLLAMLFSLLPATLPVQAASVQVAPASAPAIQPQATTNTVTLSVVAARTEPKAFGGAGVTAGDPVSQYRFLINVDNTGNPDEAYEPNCNPKLADGVTDNPNYPQLCDWPSIRTVPGAAPILTQGSEVDFNTLTSLTLPDGKYLISVIAEGYKIGGEHFTLPMTSPATITVKLQPHPLPTATMRIKVFEDNSMVNGQFDSPVEDANGLAGFRASINDTLGEVTADLYGNPLCSIYQTNPDGSYVLDPNGDPILVANGLGCFSDASGNIVIPFLGPMRYDVLVVPPDGTQWTETTTLEGSWSWDTWLMEGGTGLDNEFIVAGEPFPWTVFGYTKPTAAYPVAANTGTVKGVVVAAQVYTPFQGGLPYLGEIWGGLSGAKIDKPIDSPWIALNDLQNGDTATYVGRGNPDGSFNIPNVPPGNYTLTYWDSRLFYLMDFVQITVTANQTTDTGVIFLTSWFNEVHGSVFNDLDSDGKRDTNEPGIPGYTITLKNRDNSTMDRMTVSVVTDINGNYVLEKTYPLTSWIIVEAYNDRYYTTGITYQTSNQPTETTILGGGVDVGVLPIIGQSGRLDWGVKPYTPGTNGGIVGTVFYDSMRNEQDARYAKAEPYQPGIPNMTVNLYATVKDINGNFVKEADGSFKKGPLLNTLTTETFVQPTDCQARDVDGNAVDHLALPPAAGGKLCLEGPMTGMQFQDGFTEIDGNYGFGEILNDPITGAPLPTPIPMPVGDYLVEIVPPTDSILGRSLYQVTREEDINVFVGDSVTPQIPEAPCAGALHTVDVLGVGVDGPDAVYNPAFAGVGGSAYEGQQMPYCDVRMVTVNDQRSVAPGFFFFTDVPIPGKWKGYIINDLNLSTDPRQLFFGEKAGIPNSPIGIYDFNNQLLDTINSDYNGVFETLMPSSSTYNCPTPGGLCPSVYYLVGNDPGQPGKPNANYDPLYRTIGASFEVYPGRMVPADLAPVQIGTSLTAPGTQFNVLKCMVDDFTPQLFAVSKPYVTNSGSFTITGVAFGATQGLGKVTLDGSIVLPVTSWNDRQIVVSVPAGTPKGTHQLAITNNGGKATVNGLTFHVLGTGYNPNVYEVGPGRTYDPAVLLHPIQTALDAAAASPGTDLVVVYPGAQVAFTNPLGIYYENPILYAPVKLQGVGPGGTYADSTGVPGSILDGRTAVGDTEYATWWNTFVQTLAWDGNQNIYEGPVIYVLAQNGEFTSTFPAAVDGFIIQGGNQQGQAGAQALVQGGGVFANAYARYFQVTNNILQTNGGSYGGAIRLGTPDLSPNPSNFNDHIKILHNRVIANGGVNLAGGIGIFAGADAYEVAYNDICGNYSSEYGGGISHYGYSPNGSIHNNRIYYNQSYDEGGGIMIAGQLPTSPTLLSPGAGSVNIYSNLIQANLANDDGGGLRFLMAGNFTYNVYNNIIANNVSTHEGGGVALNDAPKVNIYNNTIVKNITTATAMTSNGAPAPAGVSTSANSSMLQATLPVGSPLFSNPVLFNNLFWDNRAGTWDGTGVSGIGQPGDPFPVSNWDLGVADGAGVLSPKFSLLQVPYGLPEVSNLVGADPLLVAPYTTDVVVLPWRGNPNFVGVDIVAVEAPISLTGDYHIQTTSPAVNKGGNTVLGVFAPLFDFDSDGRPTGLAFDIGADEIPGLFYTLMPFISR
ncbi:MAG TPA: SdrD B-like domain-containing protein [Anaerolineaceae bacterium]|nr:SdrD B-like domain-containing protein [Anaerolineaceae bacterium]